MPSGIIRGHFILKHYFSYFLKIDLKLPNYWKGYFLQSADALLSILLITLIIPETPVVIASTSATAFIFFTLPINIIARPHCTIGEHSIGFFILVRTVLDLEHHSGQVSLEV